MSHLRLVPPLPGSEPLAPSAPSLGTRPRPRAVPGVPVVPVVPAAREPLATRPAGSPWDDPKVVALSFFQAASGVCLCRACSMRRHPSYGG